MVVEAAFSQLGVAGGPVAELDSGAEDVVVIELLLLLLPAMYEIVELLSGVAEELETAFAKECVCPELLATPPVSAVIRHP